jgi:hypothetical protein
MTQVTNSIADELFEAHDALSDDLRKLEEAIQRPLADILPNLRNELQRVQQHLKIGRASCRERV